MAKAIHSSPEEAFGKGLYGIRMPSEQLEDIERALMFLRTCVRKGLAHSFDTVSGRWAKPYPEATGYLLSLFCRRGYDLRLIESMARRLISLQQPCGGFRSFHGRLVYVFDTAQICKGLLDWYVTTKVPEALRACRRGAEFVLSMQLPSGAFFPIFDEVHRERVSVGSNWGNSFSTIHCKCVEFLARMTELGFGDYREACERTCQWTLEQPQLLYSHPGAYSLEGLLAGGYRSEVKTRLQEHFIPRIEPSGYLSYHQDLPYAYVSGTVQIGLLCVRVGLMEPALRIWQWTHRVQERHPSGGLFQYANPDGSLSTHVHAEINSWGTKYYVELVDNLLSAANESQ